MAEAAGVEIPKGSPGQLHAAAAAWKALGATLEADARRLHHAASAAVRADWQGPASGAYDTASTLIALTFTSGASACQHGATACRQFSTALRDAQHRAKDAKRRAEHAIARRDAARRKADEATGRITAANTAAEHAAHNAATAAAAGPAGSGALSTAHSASRSAAHAREIAEADLRHANEEIKDAEQDLRAARKDGEEANHDAERAGRTAAQAFSALGAEAQPVTVVGVPVPVSLRGAESDGLPGSGDLFHGPGRFGSPGAARAAQIEGQDQAARDAAEPEKSNKGTIWDGLSGLTNSLTFGIVDPGGDKNSDRYRGGDLAGYIPITPMGVGKDLEKIGAKVVARKVEKKALKEAEERAAAKAARRKARQEAIKDRRPGESVKAAIERRAQEYQQALDDIAKKDFKRATRTDILDHVSKAVNGLVEHRVPGLPDVLVAIAHDWPTTRAAAEYGLERLKQFLRR